MEVDGWTGFSRHLEHAGGAEPRTPDLLVHCHASILAQACNFGLTRMAQLADLSYRQLAWCTTWYFYQSFMGYDPANKITLIVWTNLTVSLDEIPTANALMLKVLDAVYVESPLRQAQTSTPP